MQKKEWNKMLGYFSWCERNYAGKEEKIPSFKLLEFWFERNYKVIWIVIAETFIKRKVDFKLL